MGSSGENSQEQKADKKHSQHNLLTFPGWEWGRDWNGYWRPFMLHSDREVGYALYAEI